VRLLLPETRVLSVVALPERPPYPATQLATLFQPDTGDVLKLVCAADCAPALRLADGPVTVELRGRAIETSDKGRAFKLSITGVAGSGGDRDE
jgi:hypothetical protein